MLGKPLAWCVGAATVSVLVLAGCTGTPRHASLPSAPTTPAAVAPPPYFGFALSTGLVWYQTADNQKTGNHIEEDGLSLLAVASWPKAGRVLEAYRRGSECVTVLQTSQVVGANVNLDRLPRLESIGGLVTAISLSPAGDAVAFAELTNDRTRRRCATSALSVVTIANGQQTVVPLNLNPDQHVSDLAWLSDDRLAVVVGRCCGRSGQIRVLSIPRSRSNQSTPLTPLATTQGCNADGLATVADGAIALIEGSCPAGSGLVKLTSSGVVALPTSGSLPLSIDGLASDPSGQHLLLYSSASGAIYRWDRGGVVRLTTPTSRGRPIVGAAWSGPN